MISNGGLNKSASRLAFALIGDVPLGEEEDEDDEPPAAAAAAAAATGGWAIKANVNKRQDRSMHACNKQHTQMA